MRKLLLSITLFLAFIINFSAKVMADIAPPSSHLCEKCVRIMNLDNFNDIVILSVETNFSGEPTVDRIIHDHCLTASYKFHVIDLYWITKRELTMLGGIKKISFKTLRWTSGGARFEKKIPKGLNLLMDNIGSNYHYVINKSPVSRIEIECTLYRTQPSGISFFISRIRSEYNNGAPDMVEVFINDPAIQIEQKKKIGLYDDQNEKIKK